MSQIELNELQINHSDGTTYVVKPSGEGGSVDPSIIIATNEEYVEGSSETKSPNVNQVKGDVDNLYTLMSLTQNRIVPLLDNYILADGTYELNDSADNYDYLLATYGSRNFNNAALTSAITSNLGAYTLVPALSSAASNPNYVVTAYGINSGISPYSGFNQNVLTYMNFGSSVAGKWLQIQKLDGPFKTDMFTLYFPRVTSTATNLFLYGYKIQGSNDGTTWDDIIHNTNTMYGGTALKSRTHYLQDFVEYSYIRIYILSSHNTTHCFFGNLLIQDSRKHESIYQDGMFASSDQFIQGENGTINVDGKFIDVSLEGGRVLLNLDGMMYNKSVSHPLGTIIGWELDILPPGYLWCDGTDTPDTCPDLKAILPVLPDRPGYIIQAVSPFVPEQLKVISLPTDVGSVSIWTNTDILPEGFLWANGAPVPVEYPALQAIYPDGVPNVPGCIVQAWALEEFKIAVDTIVDYYPKTPEEIVEADGNWYRIWKSGFIEQGGVITAAAAREWYANITFLTPFTTTRYNITGIGNTTTCVCLLTHSATQARIQSYGYNTSNNTTSLRWKAEGY